VQEAEAAKLLQMLGNEQWQQQLQHELRRPRGHQHHGQQQQQQQDGSSDLERRLRAQERATAEGQRRSLEVRDALAQQHAANMQVGARPKCMWTGRWWHQMKCDLMQSEAIWCNRMQSDCLGSGGVIWSDPARALSQVVRMNQELVERVRAQEERHKRQLDRNQDLEARVAELEHQLRGECRCHALAGGHIVLLTSAMGGAKCRL
jgi:hypothetical protein